MSKNPDIYLLYEYMEKVPFTVRMKACLDTTVDVDILTKAAQEAIGRFPYFSVKVGLDEGQNYTLEHNDRPIAVIPEKDERLTLGSKAVNGHLVAITYRDDSIWFNYSHTFCGATGGLSWAKATLYLYMTEVYGPIEPPRDIKLPGTPVTDGELFFPDADKLPDDEPISRYTGGDINLHLGRFLKYLLNPFAKDNYCNPPANMVLFSHTIGPVWPGGQHKEPELLADCYRNLLRVWRRLQNAYTLHWQQPYIL